MSERRSLPVRIVRWVLRTLLLLLGPTAAVIAGFWFYMNTGRYVTTENAYVKTELITVSAEVTAPVVEVVVRDNQLVRKGDVLVRLDPSRFHVARAQAEAELAAARQMVRALKARLQTRRAELRAAERDAEYLGAELTRAESLRKRGTISESKVSEARRAATQAETKVDVARQAVDEVLSELAGNPDLPAGEYPSVLRAQAALDQAALDLAATEVRAPADAIAANVRLQTGEYLEKGDAMLSLVSTGGFWVEANLKETDLTHLRVGQTAELEIDAYPGVIWQAEVASLAPATGAEYALLPPQNASGNWVKVVQRVPVRLTIAPQPGAPDLRAGMSVAVSIDTGYERPLPQFVATAKAWILPDEAP